MEVVKPEPEKEFTLPIYCMCCGALLQGGATKHLDDCSIRKLIEEHFPKRAGKS